MKKQLLAPHPRALLASLLIAMLLVVGCSTARHPNHDGAIENRVRKNIAAVMTGHAYFAEVQVHDGVVTLNGNTRSEEDRRTIGNAANKVKGVRTVINNIAVDNRT